MMFVRQPFFQDCAVKPISAAAWGSGLQMSAVSLPAHVLLSGTCCISTYMLSAMHPGGVQLQTPRSN